MMNKIKGIFVEEQGQGMTEYGLVLGVIAVGVVGILIALRGKITSLFQKVNNDLGTAINNG
jgi:pilus assembly protein Flp/PilA